MTIAYDNVRPSPRPERWNMHRVLVFSCLMGLLSFAESMGLLLIGLEWIAQSGAMRMFPLDKQTPADHGVPAACGRRASACCSWCARAIRCSCRLIPALPLFAAIVATQIAAILICGFGILMPKLSWPAIAAVWIYSLAWMVVLDIVKLLYLAACR